MIRDLFLPSFDSASGRTFRGLLIVFAVMTAALVAFPAFA